nr:hypothetical protein [Tanacetum cinerariifolium]
MTADDHRGPSPLTDGPPPLTGGPAALTGADVGATWRLDKWDDDTWYCSSRSEKGSVLGTVATVRKVQYKVKKVQYEVRESSILEADVAQGDWWIGNLQLPMMRYEE